MFFASLCSIDETTTTRDLNTDVDAARREGASCWKRRKWLRWLTPQCVSKPSFVRPSGTSQTPALQIRIFSFPFAALVISAAHFRTLSRLVWSSSNSSRCLSSDDGRISFRASRAFERFRAVRKSRAPVLWRASVVSRPRPEEQPGMTIVLSWSLLMRPSSSMIWEAVGRASPAPCGLAWTAAYRLLTISKGGLRTLLSLLVMISWSSWATMET